MKLTKVRVADYKSIIDSQDFETGDITCLVGKNESGKTAVLQALYKLNPVVAQHGSYDVTEEYPRAYVEEYRRGVEKQRRDAAEVVVTDFALDAGEIAEIETVFGTGVLKAAPQVRVIKRYDNTLIAVVAVDEQRLTANLLVRAGFDPAVRTDLELPSTVKAAAEFLAQDGQRRDTAMAAAQAEANQVADAAEKAAALERAAALGEMSEARTVREELARFVQFDPSETIWSRFLKAKLPKFLYFDEYYQLSGQVNIPALKERQQHQNLWDSDRPMLALIDLAQLNIDQLVAAANTQELKSRLQGTSAYLSKKILQYWSQNQHIQLQFDLREGRPHDPDGLRNGQNLWTEVFDSAHYVTLPVGTRSRGFIWFFSFLAWFSQQREANENLILLLDEPGLFLHASAQADLLRYIETELAGTQVIYTTHSPFMVDPHHFERIRIVRDRSLEEERALPREQEGTKVVSDVLQADENSLFPLQGALGFGITQTLFVGPHCLIVEGVSDLLYLQTISGVLARAHREGLDGRWTITPVGGSDKVTTFVALLGSQKDLNVATLIDIQAKDEQSIDNLYKEKLLKKRQVLTFRTFTGGKEADIEDMFDRALYLELVSSEYSSSISALTLADLTSRHPRILVQVKEHFAAHPMKDGARFNHYRPARYFSEKISHLEAKLDAVTLDRFEEAFRVLNALIP